MTTISLLFFVFKPLILLVAIIVYTSCTYYSAEYEKKCLILQAHLITRCDFSSLVSVMHFIINLMR